MLQPVVIECVANVSEGRDKKIIEKCSKAIRAIDNVKLMHIDNGYDVNRTVFSFIGNEKSIFEAAFSLIKTATQFINMQNYGSDHPNIGAVDVCPFIPIKGIREEKLIVLVNEFSKKVNQELDIPIFLYEKSQTKNHRTFLEQIRRGGKQKLITRINQSSTWKPDFGHQWNEKTGATVIGVRNILVAFNIDISTKNKKIASELAAKIRTSGSKKNNIKGMFPCLKAISWWMESFDTYQISCNFTDIEKTKVHEVWTFIEKFAKNNNFEVTGAELIGLIPLQVLLDAATYYDYQGSDEEKAEKVFKRWNLSKYWKDSYKKKILDSYF